MEIKFFLLGVGVTFSAIDLLKRMFFYETDDYHLTVGMMIVVLSHYIP